MNRCRPMLYPTLLSLAAALHPGTAHPEDSARLDGRALEEVVVTARRYEESLQDAPISVGVMSGEFLAAQNIDQVKDIIDISPGTGFTRLNKLQNVFSMRGLNSQTEGAAGDPSVLTVVDDVVYVKDYMKSAEFFDVERVEVLRGPQGTSFGRNATGGLVHIISNRPTHDPETVVTAGVGTYGHWSMDGVINGAVADRAAARLAVHYTTHDGYTRDVLRNRDLAGEENLSARASLLLEPSYDLEIYLKAEYSKDDDGAPVRQARDCRNPMETFTNFVDPCSPWRTATSQATGSGEPFDLERETLNLTAQATWAIQDALRLTSITAYLDGEGDYNMDTAGTPRDLNFSITRNDSSQFSQELRLDSHAAGGALRWLVGLYYLNDDHDRQDGREWFQEDLSVFGPGPPFSPTAVTAVSNNQTESLGVFGEVSRDLTDKLTGTLGLRYSYDEKDFVISHSGSGFGGPVTNFLAEIPENGGPCPPGPTCALGFEGATAKEDWDHLSYMASLRYDVSDDMMVYGTVSEAYKTGGFNGEPQTAADAVVPYDEETALNYELGMKMQWLDRLRINASAFLVEYDDQQVNVFRDGGSGFVTQVIDNAASSEVRGVELDFAWQVTGYFRLSGTFARLDAEFEDTLIQTGPGPASVTDISGNRPNNVPKWTGTLVGNVELPLRDGSLVALQAQWRGRSSVYNDIVNDEAFRRPGTDVVGARVAWTSADQRWQASVWGRNLTEEVDVLNIGPRAPFLGDNPTGFGAPRTYGATITHRLQ